MSTTERSTRRPQSRALRVCLISAIQRSTHPHSASHRRPQEPATRRIPPVPTAQRSTRPHPAHRLLLERSRSRNPHGSTTQPPTHQHPLAIGLRRSAPDRATRVCRPLNGQLTDTLRPNDYRASPTPPNPRESTTERSTRRHLRAVGLRRSAADRATRVCRPFNGQLAGTTHLSGSPSVRPVAEAVCVDRRRVSSLASRVPTAFPPACSRWRVPCVSAVEGSTRPSCGWPAATRALMHTLCDRAHGSHR